MILLDTNVVSALMAPAPPSSVLTWINRHSTETIFLSTITIAEISYGIWILPSGRRRESLTSRFSEFVTSGFAQRILSFDARSAAVYGEVMAHRREIARPLSSLDGQIASIARTHSLAVATRNLRDFEECGIALVNPFTV
jgi:predicted nucleic acid-binding protein